MIVDKQKYRDEPKNTALKVLKKTGEINMSDDLIDRERNGGKQHTTSIINNLAPEQDLMTENKVSDK